MAVVTSGKERRRAAEREAKEKRLRKWKDYRPTNTALSLPVSSRSFSGRAIEVVNADALVVKKEQGSIRKCSSLASDGQTSRKPLPGRHRVANALVSCTTSRTCLMLVSSCGRS